MHLGKLYKVADLRSVWKNEAYDFTKWLSKEKNISHEGMGDSENTNEINYWLYAPGPGACFWEEYYEKSIMCMGSDEGLGNLLQYDSKEKIVKKL